MQRCLLFQNQNLAEHVAHQLQAGPVKPVEEGYLIEVEGLSSESTYFPLNDVDFPQIFTAIELAGLEVGQSGTGDLSSEDLSCEILRSDGHILLFYDPTLGSTQDLIEEGDPELFIVCAGDRGDGSQQYGEWVSAELGVSKMRAAIGGVLERGGQIEQGAPVREQDWSIADYRGYEGIRFNLVTLKAQVAETVADFEPEPTKIITY